MTLPKIWRRFTVKQRDGTELKLRIQDLPHDRLNDALDFYTKFMIPEESFHKAAGIQKNEDAIAEARMLMVNLAPKPTIYITICCRDDSEDFDDIIGMQGVELEKRTDCNESEKLTDLIQTEELKNLLIIVQVNTEIHNFIEKFDLDQCFSGIGLTVDPRYRGLGIAQELLKTRYMLCEEHNVPLSEAWMTSVASQKAAAKVGWKTSIEVPSKELAKRTGLDFVGSPDVFKAMYIELSK